MPTFIPTQHDSSAIGHGRAGLLRWMLRSLGCAIGVSYVVMLPHFYELANAETRFTLKWNWTHFGGIVLGVLLQALVFWAGATGISLLLNKWGWRRIRWGFHAGLGALAVILMIHTAFTILAFSVRPSWLMRGGLLGSLSARLVIYLLAPLGMLLSARRAFPRVVRALCMLALAMFGVFAATALTYSRYPLYASNPPLPPVTGIRGIGLPNVFILVFDEWSYDRTYPDGVLREDLPNLARLSQMADTHHRYFSPASSSIPSLSRFLFQRDEHFVTLSYDAVVDSLRANRKPTGPSIFASHDSHFRAAFGNLLDYPLLLAADVDYVSYIPYMDTPATLSMRIGDLLLRPWGWLRHLGIPTERLTQRMRGGGVRSVILQVDLMMQLAARTALEPVYAFCHVLLPHDPFVWDADGLVSRMDFRSRSEAYAGNLRYMDAVIGRFTDTLHQAGMFDHALLIITSDHGWREDPAIQRPNSKREDTDPFSPIKHVPMLIKRPGQHQPRQVDESFSYTRIYPLIRQALTSEPESREEKQLVQEDPGGREFHEPAH